MREVVHWYDYALGAVCLAVFWAAAALIAWVWFGRR